MLVTSVTVIFFLIAVFAVSIYAAKCPDLSSLRSNYVVDNFNQSMAVGFWYEIAYKDVAQVGESCQYYSRDTDDSDINGFAENFGFTYGGVYASHLELYYASTNDTGLYEKYMKKTPFAKFPVVVVDVTLADSGGDEYSTITEYLCSEIGPVKYEEIRIGSRDPSISDEKLERILSVLEDQGIDTNGIKYVDQSEDCKYQ